jgi:hypothetical protein
VVAKVGSKDPLTDAQARSLARADASTIRSLAGRPRWLEEMTSGKSAVDDEEPFAGTNPQGLVGVDLSGPPFGSAILHPIAWYSGILNTLVIAPPGPLDSIPAGTKGAISPWRIWVRPHAKLPLPSVAPYSRGLVVLRAHRVGGVDGTVTVSARQLGDDVSATKTGTFTVTTTETAFALASTFWVPFKPGSNDIELTVEHSISGALVTIDSLVIYNGQKRSH